MAHSTGSERDGADAHLHVAMFPFFAFGHIIPFVQLSKRLAANGVKVSFLSAPANVPRIRSLLSSASGESPAAAVDVVPLEFPTVEGLPPEVQSTAVGTPIMAELLKHAVNLMKPQVEYLLADLRPHAIFYDFAQTWIPSVAHPLGIKTLFFVVLAALPIAYLGAPSRGRWDDLTSPPARFPSPPNSTVDGVPAYQAASLSYIFKSFYDMPCVYDRMVMCMSESSAVVIKSCREIEGPYLDYLEAEYKKPVLLAGPIVPEPPTGELEERWKSWLDTLPAASVIYCCFGSEAFFTDEEIMKLALGLELTGMPFILVINFPVGSSEQKEEEDAMQKLRGKLPEGFEERVQGRGVVHSGWVQQYLLLAHPSVGCNLCHAGLGSMVEGVLNGCQLVLLPQKGDQLLNARLFAGDLRVAVEVPRRGEDGRFSSEDVKESVRKVMVGGEEEPGRTVRENNKRWREFLLDAEVDPRYTTELVEKLKAMTGFR